MSDFTLPDVVCSFCGKKSPEVAQMTTNQDAAICSECIAVLSQGSIASKMSKGRARKLTLYRDDGTVQVVYDSVKAVCVKAVFWTAGNTVLVISQYTDIETGAHRYVCWPRERFCWFKDEPDV